MKKAFTLIELLAVIIILAVIALIATPVVLKVVDNAKESARKSSVSGYADTVRLAIVEKQFETGVSPSINQAFLDSLSYQGEKVSCSEVINSSKYGVVLHECNVGTDVNKYCFVMGKVYDCSDNNYKTIYDDAKADTDNEEVGYKDNSGANKPELYDKMIPVLYNTTTNKWQYADINEEWYDYNEKWWANAIVLNPGSSYNIGQDIEISDIAMMYVWIPKYKYTIFNANNEIINKQQIDVTFESGTNKTGTISCSDAINQVDSHGNKISEKCIDSTHGSIINNTSTYTHPAFTFGDKQLTGIWVGKFEVSTTNSTCLNNQTKINCDNNSHKVIVKPNLDTLRYISLSNLFDIISNIKTDYNMENIDSHVIKNMEWGAVAYLTNSKYGRCENDVCEEVTINNVQKNPTTYTTQTGCAGATITAAASATCQNEYHTTNGMKASTTGNIYGIYDMSGGAVEMVMGNMVNSSGEFFLGSSGFVTIPDKKYYDSYTNDSSSRVSFSRGKLGDATKEIMAVQGSNPVAWNGDTLYFPHSTYPLILRGGIFVNQAMAGVFYFNYVFNSVANQYDSTRPVIVTS